MQLIGLLLAIVMIVTALARLGVSAAMASFSWADLVFHLVTAGLTIGLVQAIGSQINAGFARQVDHLIKGGPVTVRKGIDTWAFGFLMLTLIPLLVYLLVLALAASLAIGYYTSQVLVGMPRVPFVVPLAIIILVLGTVLATLLAIYHLLFPPRAELSGHSISRDKHARLWNLSREIANELGTKPIDVTTLTVEPGMAVYQLGGLVTNLLGRGRRVLQIGLPSLYDLTVPQFTAILVHEYSHFSHGDTRWGMVRFYLSNALRAAVGAMPGPGDGMTGMVMAVNPGYWLLRFYWSLFWGVTGGFQRLNEVLADMAAIRRCGGSAFRDGLMKVAMSGPVFEEALSRYYVPEINIGKPTVSDPAILMRRVYEQAAPADLRRMRVALLDPETASPYDSHPPLQTRLDYAAAHPDAPPPSDEPASSLFDEWEGINAYAMAPLNEALTDRA